MSYPNTTEFLKGLFAQGANIMDLQSKQGAALLDAMRSDLNPPKVEAPLSESTRYQIDGSESSFVVRTYRETTPEPTVQQPTERWTNATHHSLGNGCYQSRKQGGAE